MSTRKAVVMAAGRGTRMRREEHGVTLTPAQTAAADAGLKSMIPVGRPFLDYVLNALGDGGITDVCIVIAAGDDRIRRRYERDVAPARIRIAFAEQREPRGTADALLTAQQFAAADSVLVLNGDNLYSAHAISRMAAEPGFAIAAYHAASLVERGNIPRERLRAYATIDADSEGRLKAIHEKPGDAVRITDETLISMNLWALPPQIFDACARVTPSVRGELELASAVRIVLDQGVPFRVVEVNDGVLDLTERSDIPDVAARLHDVVVRL